MADQRRTDPAAFECGIDLGVREQDVPFFQPVLDRSTPPPRSHGGLELQCGAALGIVGIPMGLATGRRAS
jgi:hypothetical protein